jgi:hypothetical protein
MAHYMTRHLKLVLVETSLTTRLQCIRIPTAWRTETVMGTDGISMTWFLPEKVDVSRIDTYDPWEMRADFQRVKEGDTQSALSFLNRVGLFMKADIQGALLLAETADKEHRRQMTQNYRYFEAEDGSHRVEGSILPTAEEDFWLFRKTWIRQLAAPESSSEVEHFDYAARLTELPRRKASVVITTTTFEEAFHASLRIDQITRQRIRNCARPDCPVMFSKPASRTRRKFCSWYCGHIESVRKSRRKP